jgi:hypothetical protein
MLNRNKRHLIALAAMTMRGRFISSVTQAAVDRPGEAGNAAGNHN